jgi:predicted metal-dependent phosphoesterase TrpH
MAKISENPFTQDGVWLKGNTHTHTTRSDGHVEPEERLAQYRDAGYDFLALTDHLKIFDAKENPYDDMVVINALEFHPQHPNSNSGDWHFIALDVESDAEKVSTEISAQVQVNKFKKQGAYIVLCHPYWCGFTREQMQLIKGVDAIEVYNYVCEVLTGKGDSSSEYDSLLLDGDRPHSIASDDCHSKEHVFGGWIVVKAKDKSKDGIMDALRRGAYYSSCGPEIKNIEFKDGELHVECSPVNKISIISKAQRGVQLRADEGKTLESGSIELKKLNSFVRIQIEDSEGRRAWSQAYELD